MKDMTSHRSLLDILYRVLTWLLSGMTAAIYAVFILFTGGILLGFVLSFLMAF